jgi:nucleotide-binding universal stress UspA family protein
MFNRVMVPVDGSAFAESALPLALLLGRSTDARIHLVMVHERMPLTETATIIGNETIDAQQRQAEEEYLGDLITRLAAPGKIDVERSLITGTPGAALAQFAGRRGVDMIVMSTHGRGALSRMWLGSVADQVIRRSRIPVLLARPTGDAGGATSDVPGATGAADTAFATDTADAADTVDATDAPGRPASTATASAGVAGGPAGIRRVLIALDGSPDSEITIPHAGRLCAATGAECTVIRVVVPPARTITSRVPDTARMVHDRTAEEDREAEEYLRGLIRDAPPLPEGTRAEVVIGYDVAAAILQTARTERADVIAIATRGHGRAARLLLGSVADKVIRGAHIPVLVCPVPR